MDLFDTLSRTGHEQVVLCQDPTAGYRAIIAVHSTRLGPAVGGVRMWRYDSGDAALTDALRLSRGMTYKNALAGLAMGGGKSVVILEGADGARPEGARREVLLRTHARFVDSLGGRYIAAEDVGTSPADMEVMLGVTRHVAGLASRSGDPSPMTARGVFRATQAAAEARWGSGDLRGRTVAVQGVGSVGGHLCRWLREAGAELVVTDIDRARADRVAAEHGGRAVAPEAIYDAPADVFAPCAMGGILDDHTIPRLAASVVCGAANNQLLEDRHGDLLRERGVLYVPDFVANAGGVINGARELLGWAPEASLAKLDALGETVRRVLALADSLGISTQRAAERLAEERLAGARAGA